MHHLLQLKALFLLPLTWIRCYGMTSRVITGVHCGVLPPMFLVTHTPPTHPHARTRAHTHTHTHTTLYSMNLSLAFVSYSIFLQLISVIDLTS
jgi:hypothetical protein